MGTTKTTKNADLLNALVLSQVFSVLDDPVVGLAVVTDHGQPDRPSEGRKRSQDFTEGRNLDVPTRIGLGIGVAELPEHLDLLEVVRHVERVQVGRVLFQQLRRNRKPRKRFYLSLSFVQIH